MQPSTDRPITLPEDLGLFVHYSAMNAYGVRFHNLYDEEEPDNWLINEIQAGRYKLYKVPNTNLFQAIKQTTNRSEREIIELSLAAEIDRPLVEGQLTIPEGQWTVDEYPGVAEMLRWDPVPSPHLAQGMPIHQYGGWDPLPPAMLAHMPLLTPNVPFHNPPPVAQVTRLLLEAVALVEETHPMNLWDFEVPHQQQEPIPPPLAWPAPRAFLLPMDCSYYNRPSIASPQKRIADIVIADAVVKGESCSITMNPLTPQSAACVAPCYHIFQKEAIQTWLQSKHTCPQCREPCAL